MFDVLKPGMACITMGWFVFCLSPGLAAKQEDFHAP
jgi:hypothetical protein